MLPLFDLHCDTLTRAYENKYSLFDSSLQASFCKSKAFLPYIQVMAIWTNNALTDSEGYKRYLSTYKFAKAQGVSFATFASELTNSALILSIEDARIIEDDISRLSSLYSDGVRIITPLWKDISRIGGAWNTNLGLTDFGKKAISKMVELGITVDLSHASCRSFYDILLICVEAGKIPIASHSNSYFACPHRRNLLKSQARDLIGLNSLIGISLAPEHLNASSKADISDILRHIDYYLALGAKNSLCLGCDFDGIRSLPNGIDDISDLENLYFCIEKQFGKEIANKIFFENAYAFTVKNILD